MLGLLQPALRIIPVTKYALIEENEIELIEGKSVEFRRNKLPSMKEKHKSGYSVESDDKLDTVKD